MARRTFFTDDPHLKDTICNKGLRATEKLFNLEIKRDLFDCCSYQFDGYWVVAHLPDDTSLYHGSMSLPHYMYGYPLGANYLRDINLHGLPIGENVELESEKAVENIINNYGNPNTGWFSNPDTVYVYSNDSRANQNDNPDKIPQCSLDKLLPDGTYTKSCIFAYKAPEGAKMLLIEDSYNIYKLFYSIESITPIELIEIQRQITSHGLSQAKGGVDVVTIANVQNVFLKFFGFNTWDPGNPNNDDDPGITDFRTQVELRERPALRPFRHGGAPTADFYKDTYTMVPVNRFMLWDIRPGYDRELVVSRRSQYQYDISFSYVIKVLMQRYEGDGKFYDGYCAGRQYKFHDEMILFNSEKVLDRDYMNPVDWQYNPRWDLIPLRVKDYIQTIKKDVIINYKEYAGNIYECAVWCALYMEAIVEKPQYLTYYTAHGPSATLKTNYDTFRQILAHNNINSKLLSCIAFLHNFGLRQDCQPPNEYDISKCDIRIINNLKISYVPETVLEELGISDNLDKFLLYVTLDAFLEFNKIARNDYAKIDIDIINIIITQNSLLYNIQITDQLISVSYIIGLLVTICSLFTRSSVLPGLQGLPPGNRPVIGAPPPPNIHSNHLHLSNISKLYPGTEIYINQQDLIVFNILNILKEQNTNKDQNMKDIIGIRDSIIQTEEKIFVNKMITEINIVITQLNALGSTNIGQSKKLSYKLIHDLNHLVEKHKTEGKPEGYSAYYLDLILASRQSNLIKNTVLGINIIKTTPEEPGVILGSTQERVWYAFNLARPILEVIFRNFSSKPYPAYRKYEIPRMNHNGVNHLRQSFFTGILMINTNVVEKYNLNNADLILLLIVGYCISIGRINEVATSDNPQNMPTLPDGWLSKFFPGQEEIGKNIGTYNVNQVPRLLLNSGIMIYQILEAVQTFIDLKTSSTLFHHIISLTMAKLKDLDTFYGQHGDDVDKWIDIAGLINVGHYLDHCRPSTGYAQLNTKGIGDGQGSPFVKNFLTRNISGGNIPEKWNNIKFTFFKIQLETISRTTGYTLPIGWEEQLKQEMLQNKESHCRDLWGRYHAGLNPAMMEMVSKDFELLWNRIFYNSNIKLGNWHDNLIVIETYS